VAHPGQPGEIGDPRGLGVVVADPPDRPVHMGQAAVGQADLPHHRAVRAGEQPPEDLLLDQGGEHGRVGRGVEQPQQTGDGIEQFGTGVAGRQGGRVGGGA
jgi:hypothetical protein